MRASVRARSVAEAFRRLPGAVLRLRTRDRRWKSRHVRHRPCERAQSVGHLEAVSSEAALPASRVTPRQLAGSLYARRRPATVPGTPTASGPSWWRSGSYLSVFQVHRRRGTGWAPFRDSQRLALTRRRPEDEKPPPPMLPAVGCVTASANAVATAASMALPPRARIAAPASHAGADGADDHTGREETPASFCAPAGAATNAATVAPARTEWRFNVMFRPL